MAQPRLPIVRPGPGIGSVPLTRTNLPAPVGPTDVFIPPQSVPLPIVRPWWRIGFAPPVWNRLPNPAVASGGITQPSGNGGDIFYDDDENSDAALDGIAGSYHFEDLYQRSQANGWKASDGITGAVEKWGGAVFGLIPRYWFHVNIQNGDGVSTRTTTLKASRCEVMFDSGKTMKVSAVGLANRWTILGSLQEVVPNDPMGYDGCDITLGATTVIDGNPTIYGTRFRTIGANIGFTLRMASTSAIGDAVDVAIDQIATGSPSTIAFGTSAIPFGRARHIYTNILGAAGAGVNLFNVTDAADIHLDGVSNTRLNVTNAYTRIRDGVVHGIPATADIRGSSGSTDLIDFTWSGQAPQQSSSSGTTNDWRTYLPTVVDSVTGLPITGVSLSLVNAALATVVGPVVSNSQGQFSYTTPGQSGPAITNAVIARARVSSSVWTEQGPFTATFTLAGYETRVMKFSWPRTTGLFGDQLQKVMDVVTMRALTLGPTADFSMVPGGGALNVSVSFTDESAAGDAAITAWSWTFGDGGTSTLQNPTHVYAASGLYTVSLQVTTSLGTSTRTMTNEVYVAPHTLPTASFTGTPLTGVSSLTVAFTDASTPGNDPITSWAWDFGDGQTSTAQNPTHLYGIGTFTVSLTVTTASGSNSQVRTGYVVVAQSFPREESSPFIP